MSGPATAYTGRAGEYFVASHLLRLGYNAMPMPVDSGIDLVAHSMTKHAESVIALFQIKTTKNRRCSFRLTDKAFQRLWRDVINVVVVFWDDPALPIAVVVPPSLLYMYTSGGHKDPRAPLRLRNGEVRFVFRRTGPRQVCIRNREHDISPMVNRFGLIEHIGHDTTTIPPYASWSDSPTSLISLR
jgi:hypothetical protein